MAAVVIAGYTITSQGLATLLARLSHHAKVFASGAQASAFCKQDASPSNVYRTCVGRLSTEVAL